jgi:hypothetical protein
MIPPCIPESHTEQKEKAEENLCSTSTCTPRHSSVFITAYLKRPTTGRNVMVPRMGGHLFKPLAIPVTARKKRVESGLQAPIAAIISVGSVRAEENVPLRVRFAEYCRS